MTTRTAITGTVRAVSAAASLHPGISAWVDPAVLLAVPLLAP